MMSVEKCTVTLPIYHGYSQFAVWKNDDLVSL